MTDFWLETEGVNDSEPVEVKKKKEPSAMEVFFLQTVWPFWLEVKYHDRKPGPKIPALDVFLKRAPTMVEAEKIFGSLQAQVKYLVEQDRACRKIDRMPHLRTWLFQYRYDDVIGGHVEIKKNVAAQKCSCGSVTNLHTFNGGYRCHACYLKQTDLDILREKFREKGLSRKPDESHEDWIRRLIETQKREIGRLLKPFARKPAQTKRLGNCWHCKGEGRYRETDETISDKKLAQWVVCPKCGGDGGKIVEREPGEDG